MAKVTLIKGRSYMYKGYVFKMGESKEVKSEDTAYLVSTGAFQSDEPEEASTPKTEVETETKAKPKKTTKK